MKKPLLLALFFAVQFSLVAQQNFFPPKTPVRAVTDTMHGVLITDAVSYTHLDVYKRQYLWFQF